MVRRRSAQTPSPSPGRARALLALPLALSAAVALPGAAWAFGGGLGCSDLPDYARAQGALEGMTSACDMSVEQARAIVAAQDGVPPAPSPVRRPHHPRHRRHLPAE